MYTAWRLAPLASYRQIARRLGGTGTISSPEQAGPARRHLTGVYSRRPANRLGSFIVCHIGWSGVAGSLVLRTLGRSDQGTNGSVGGLSIDPYRVNPPDSGNNWINYDKYYRCLIPSEMASPFGI